MKTNTGSRIITKKGIMPGLKHKVWHDSDSVANIFGLSELVKEHRTTYDSSKEDCFNVYIDNNNIIKFKNNGEGLYYFNPPKEYKESITKITGVNKQQHITTVAENRLGYTTQQFERAKEARKL